MKLNSTGSFYYLNGHYWSYNTKLTDRFKGYSVYNGTYYSATTSKHQAKLCSYEPIFDIVLTQCDYGNWDVKEMIKNEIDYIKYQIKNLEPKRNTKKKLLTIAQLITKLEILEKLISE